MLRSLTVSSTRLVALCLLAAVASALAVLAPAAPRARAQTGGSMTIDQVTVSEQQDKVTALVSVFDPAGASVPDLKDFSALVDGTTVPVESVSPIVQERQPISVLLLIDISGSMQGEPLRQARDAAKTLVQGLLPQDSAALMSFAGSVSPTADFAQDRNASLSQLDGLITQPGGTALYQAVVQGLAATAKAPAPRRAIVLLTDGQESGASQASRDDALSAAGGDNIPIFTIGLGQHADAGLLQAIANSSHGSFYRALAPADLSHIFDVVGGHLRSQYEIVVPIPKATLTSRNLVIETRVGQATVRAQAGFNTAAPPAQTATKGSGTPRWIWVAVAILVLPVLALMARRFRRRRPAQKSPVPGGPGEDLELPPPRAPAPSRAEGRTGILTVVEGPNAGTRATVSAAPVHIGTDAGCELRLDPANGSVASRHMRAWLQHDRLIMHRLVSSPIDAAAGSTPEWSTLEPQEAFRIGPHVVTFSLAREPNGHPDLPDRSG